MGQVIGSRRRLAALAVAAQVRGDDREVPGEERRDLVPHYVRLRMSMQEQDRRSASPVLHANQHLPSIHHGELESFEHGLKGQNNLVPQQGSAGGRYAMLSLVSWPSNWLGY